MLRRLLLASSLALTSVATVAYAPAAAAQDEEAISEARANFQKALELEEAGDFGQALKYFRKVGSVKKTPQVSYHIALCEEELGNLVSALGGYKIALSQGEGTMPQGFIDEVQASVTKLEAAIPKLIIQRGAGAEGAVIQLDGVKLGARKIGEEIVLDPGPHTVTAEAHGYEEYVRTVTVDRESLETLVVDLSPLPKDAPVVAGGPTDEEPKGFGVWPYVIGGVGIAAAGTGAVLLPISQSKASEVEEACGGTDCTAIGDSDPDEWRRLNGLAQDAQMLETVGWISIGVGGAAIATGVVLFLVDPSRKNKEAPLSVEGDDVSVTFSPSAPGANAGFSLLGTF